MLGECFWGMHSPTADQASPGTRGNNSNLVLCSGLVDLAGSPGIRGLGLGISVAQALPTSSVQGVLLVWVGGAYP
jgi:hypothetical protein